MKRLICKKCKHEWEYKGKSKYYATCSQCYNKVRIIKPKEEENENSNI